jgi:hypothetical protein
MVHLGDARLERLPDTARSSRGRSIACRHVQRSQATLKSGGVNPCRTTSAHLKAILPVSLTGYFMFGAGVTGCPMRTARDARQSSRRPPYYGACNSAQCPGCDGESAISPPRGMH